MTVGPNTSSKPKANLTIKYMKGKKKFNGDINSFIEKVKVDILSTRFGKINWNPHIHPCKSKVDSFERKKLKVESRTTPTYP